MPRFSPPSDGGRPENALTGSLFMVNDGATTAIQVPEADGKMRFWRNTSVATLASGTTATLPNATLGYEWDVDVDNGSRPPGLVRLSSTTVQGAPLLQDQGSTYAPGTANHALSLYRHSSGARVFGAGTVQWAWGLDANHDRTGGGADQRMQQATVNLLADMQVQPGTLQSGLVAATASTDQAAPSSTLTAPAANSSLVLGTTVTITGTAADTGGGVVGGVEVSVDGGSTWRRATGRASWSYTWLPSATGAVTIRSRAVDDSGNLEVPGVGRTVTVSPPVCPCSIWPASAVPTQASDPDTGAVNLGTRFRVAQNGYITALRFYKGSGNTGTHVGTLWSNTGAVLASATFTNETATGWQQVTLSTPVAVSAGSTYVVSYLAPNGRYAVDLDYFANSGVNSGLLVALRDGDGGGNGLYAYAASTTFPTSTYRASNYWVDVVFSTTAPDTTPPTVSSVVPAAGATGVSRTANITATFSEAMNAASITPSSFELLTATGAAVSSAVSYNSTTRMATLNPNASLAASASYTARIRGGGTDPRVKDTAGNALVATQSWSFRTGTR